AMVVENFVQSSVVVERRVFAELGGFDEDRSLSGSEDYELWLRLLLAGYRFGYVPEPLVRYRRRAGSFTSDSRSQWASHLTALERNLPALRRAGVVLPAFVTAELARRAAARGRRGDALRLALAVGR